MNSLGFKLIPASTFKKTLWKNGLGWTEQIAIHPATADLKRADFSWRVSTARIEQGSAFSAFPNHDRVLAIARGAGMRILHELEPGEEPDIAELRPGEAYEFPGDVPTRCELLDGPIQDFSVFARTGEVQGSIECLDSPQALTIEAGTSILFVVQGSVRAADQEARQGDALQIDADAESSVPCECSPGTRVLAARLTPA